MSEYSSTASSTPVATSNLADSYTDFLASPAFAQWETRCNKQIQPTDAHDSIRADLDATAPAWAVDAFTEIGLSRRDSSWASRRVRVAQAVNDGWLDDKCNLKLAFTSVGLHQWSSETEPLVRLMHRKGIDGDPVDVTNTYTLDEAADLAHALLAAVDLARNASDSPKEDR